MTTAMGRARMMVDEAVRKMANSKAGLMGTISQTWLTDRVAIKRNKPGVLMATQRLNDFILPVVGKDEPERAIGKALNIRQRCERHGLKPQTVAHVLSDFRCLMRFAGERPDLKDVMPKIPARAPDRLTDAHLDRIIAALPNSFPVRLAVETGVRYSEIRNLQWHHFVEAPTPRLIIEATKTGQVRRVPLTAEMARELRSRREIATGPFVSEYRSTNAGSLVAVTTRAGVPPWHFHQLRHTFACRWLERGGTLQALQQILGHTTPAMTQRYARLSDAAVFAEAARLESGTVGGTTKTKYAGDNELQDKR